MRATEPHESLHRAGDPIGGVVRRGLWRAVGWGLLAFAVQLGAYFAVLTAVSGWAFAREQFGRYP